MVIRVDLQCYRCYKKIKKVMCKFPEIQDQMYDEKQNTVTIKVVSCCPERILKKIASKGGKTVESIEIVPKKKPEEKPKEPKEPQEPEKPKVVVKAPMPKKLEGDNGGNDSDDGPRSLTTKYTNQFVSGYPTIYPSGIYYQPPQPYYQGYGTVPYYHGVPAYYC
ncbi:hypothetical protein EUGRSUZ_D01461 [Eucalyptus grandis]|uniref:Uncharacterized protein n=1 Tax=Eucalyptus grandis TaxID=71139 RepID=A0ACC3L494_EUCGR|nr:hypothetical protein EUGRSUZ_D01461 [Eucalyptus grandis]